MACGRSFLNQNDLKLFQNQANFNLIALTFDAKYLITIQGIIRNLDSLDKEISILKYLNNFN